MIRLEASSFPISIFMAGDAAAAKQIASAYCDEIGFCVTVSATDYVYKGGVEAGFVIGLINYPRFPLSRFDLQDHAHRIADRLREQLGQDSYTIQTPLGSVFHSWRDERDRGLKPLVETGTGSIAVGDESPGSASAEIARPSPLTGDDNV